MYSYKTQLTIPFQDAVEQTKEELQKEGFGVLTEIDVKQTLKKKLGVNFEEYVILGACNPPLAYDALQTEKEVGLLLPCNVLVYEDGEHRIVSATRPSVAMGFIDNATLREVAEKVDGKLKKVIDSMGGRK